MEDKELLRLAAKAAGYPIHSDAKWVGAGGGKPSLYMGERGPKWNPLEDDGDAFRLAVKMRFEIQCYPGMGGVIYDDGSPDGGYIQQNPEKGQTDEQAVRRAIVRAAAEMGSEIP
jgi:hypothetical protein